MAKYRKKPVEVEAVQWTGKNTTDIIAFARGWVMPHENNTLSVLTLEGEMFVSVGDYVIEGVQGEFYPCKPDIFEKTYERVEEDA